MGDHVSLHAYLGPLCALGSSVTWAVGSSAYTRLAQGHSPFAVNFARALVALPLFLATAVLVHGGVSGAVAGFLGLELSQLGWFTVSMIASYGLGDVLFLFSARSIGVPGALAIASAYPLITAGAGVVFRDEYLNGVQFLALLMTVLGVVVVILSTREPRGRVGGTSPRIGVLLAIATAFMWAMNTYALSQGGRGTDASVVNGVRMIVALLLSLTLGKILAPRAAILLPARQMLRSSWLFVFEAYGGSFLFVYGLANSSLAVGATLASLAPVISVPIAWAFGVEKFSFSRTVGVILVVVGVSLLVGTARVL